MSASASRASRCDIWRRILTVRSASSDRRLGLVLVQVRLRIGLLEGLREPFASPGPNKVGLESLLVVPI
jgi:hypothetical protein